ncbi:hypothetical protein, partial [Tannerella sp.]|uniref:hypothetical protein n=1 Tax=Tannerella sp. TaxID=2382127 RepID=UPI0026DCBFB6
MNGAMRMFLSLRNHLSQTDSPFFYADDSFFRSDGVFFASVSLFFRSDKSCFVYDIPIFYAEETF